MSDDFMSGGEFEYTCKDFRAIAAMLYEDSGIALSESKNSLVYSRLAKRLRELKLKSFKEYVQFVSSEDGKNERMNMLAALTTNLTKFFREPHHFEHLKTKLLPDLIQRAKMGGRVRIWSAGCSTGQEPYSIALTVLDVLPDAVKLDVKILATDIDPNVVAKAKEGIYSNEEVQPVPANLREKWMKKHPRGWQAGENMKALVTVKQLNLMSTWPMKGPFDAIFCRNVVIYFDEQTQARMWSRFAQLVPEGGRLYVGHSERVTETKFVSDGLTTYRKISG